MLDKMPAPTFRTAVGGYNKDDINNYIRETNASFLASSKEHEDRIHDLSTAVAERARLIAELKEKLVFVPDELYFLPQANMLRMAQTYASFYPRFDRSRFGELTDAFKLNPKANLGTFSKGMRRQAATVLALACKTDFLFLDETFDGLDPIMRNLVKKVLYADVAERGATAVITSHSLRELEDTCDQLALLHKGGIVFGSDVQNLKTTLFKVQIAFDHDYDHTLFSGFDVLNFTKHGSVSNLIVRGDRDKVVQDLRTKSPILMEVLPLSLEEVFLYEMESLGYSFGDELK